MDQGSRHQGPGAPVRDHSEDDVVHQPRTQRHTGLKVTGFEQLFERMCQDTNALSAIHHVFIAAEQPASVRELKGRDKFRRTCLNELPGFLGIQSPEPRYEVCIWEAAAIAALYAKASKHASSATDSHDPELASPFKVLDVWSTAQVGLLRRAIAGAADDGPTRDWHAISMTLRRHNVEPLLVLDPPGATKSVIEVAAHELAVKDQLDRAALDKEKSTGERSSHMATNQQALGSVSTGRSPQQGSGHAGSVTAVTNKTEETKETNRGRSRTQARRDPQGQPSSHVAASKKVTTQRPWTERRKKFLVEAAQRFYNARKSGGWPVLAKDVKERNEREMKSEELIVADLPKHLYEPDALMNAYQQLYHWKLIERYVYNFINGTSPDQEVPGNPGHAIRGPTAKWEKAWDEFLAQAVKRMFDEQGFGGFDKISLELKAKFPNIPAENVDPTPVKGGMSKLQARTYGLMKKKNGPLIPRAAYEYVLSVTGVWPKEQQNVVIRTMKRWWNQSLVGKWPTFVADLEKEDATIATLLPDGDAEQQGMVARQANYLIRNNRMERPHWDYVRLTVKRLASKDRKASRSRSRQSADVQMSDRSRPASRGPHHSTPERSVPFQRETNTEGNPDEYGAAGNRGKGAADTKMTRPHAGTERPRGRAREPVFPRRNSDSLEGAAMPNRDSHTLVSHSDSSDTVSRSASRSGSSNSGLGGRAIAHRPVPTTVHQAAELPRRN